MYFTYYFISKYLNEAYKRATVLDINNFKYNNEVQYLKNCRFIREVDHYV